MHTTTTTTNTKVSKEINSTGVSGLDNLTIPQISGALCFRNPDPIGALRMQNASSLHWERRQYDAKRAAKPNHHSTSAWCSKDKKKEPTVRFAVPLATPDRE
ncbi:Aconitase family protein [Lasiodiplodia theobromae]|uniref:Aconitase family protein n=1 Tax=Lasiodiplodia theobromae TaxID=45133 RepID=UPI0015C34533|nr:Aconitase family protein [Lasiodiplodia theobromae]KAF4534468.1 Aconitase family protein [Lasiodiplodia theobromae]